MKVLMILNYAPDYREAFLRELSAYNNIDLTVVAQPCDPAGLSPPLQRVGYNYIEISSVKYFGLVWQPGLAKIIRSRRWDIVCVSANLRHVSRIVLYLISPYYWKRWVWWGLIFGEVESGVVRVIRKQLFKHSACCLVHTKAVVVRLQKECTVAGVSFNNSEVSKSEFRHGKYDKKKQEIKMLFVGTYKPRKKLERLIQLADRRTDVKIRIVGPGMEKLTGYKQLAKAGKLSVYGRTTGHELDSHFDWADIVVSPGNVGLLIMNAARHGKGIVIDNDSYHGPELFLAKETGQPFISFNDIQELDQFIELLHAKPSLLKKWGKDLQAKAKEEYTIEHMAEVHARTFEEITLKQSTNL
ncbi:glycosyltransferase [Thiohalophilus thiocyanatoxydans]|uniref:Glycosyltransferase involved in cell wall biosynthesis n=1 Tax=Thiohalophilus thiocyanatoxydans TaxID=381308 RepID=A0A4R8IXP9_9GAMM|nr:glycosyltransferase [Thiohalophilus thiocyanatoxydans]TDY02687.1 glycosyltransferase involved in cell wall biosynthesis [Thiohalophilus thiocyanatoxydans]